MTLKTKLAIFLAAAVSAAQAAGPSAPVASPIIISQASDTRDGHELSREQVVAMVQKRFNARVVRADTADEGGRRIYVMRLLSEGSKVWTVRVDAATGDIL